VEGLRSKDKQALSWLYDHYSAALNAVVLRIVKKEEVAEEVLQDVFVKIWERFDNYDASRGRLFTWLLNIARNQAIDRSRSKEIHKDQKTGDIGNYVNRIDSSSFLEQSVDAIGLAEVLSRLPQEQKLIVEYLYLKGYTQSELSKEMNIPLGTVKTRLRLALQELRAIMGIK
jgi:RNA polymerase sigma factor (sigma-70 family)